jgi:hypothetical protein
MNKPSRKTDHRQAGYVYGVSDSMTEEEIREQWPAVVDDEALPAARWPLYEFRVTGPTAEIAWEDWFDAARITSRPGQVTVLQSRIADQSALYGMLSRLRELGLTLQSVTRRDAGGDPGGWWQRGWRAFREHLADVNWGLTIAYLLIAGALSPITVVLAQIISPTLALMALFAALGGIAFGFSRFDRGIGWRVTAWAGGLITLIILTIYLPNEAGVPAGLAIGLLMALVAGLAIWLMLRFGLIRIAPPVTPISPAKLADTGQALYEIRVRGRLDSAMWGERFTGMALTQQEDGITVLRGSINSQKTLYNLLASLRDLALPLVSVTQVAPPEK